MRLHSLWACFLVGLAAGCAAENSDPSLAFGEDPKAAAIIDQLRQQFRIPVVDPLTGETSLIPFLKPSHIIASSTDGGGLRFGIDSMAGVPTADFDLPQMSDSPTSLRARGQAPSVTFAPREAGQVVARLGRGYLLFSSAHRQGGHMIRGATADGLEDYVVFPQRPPEESMRYRLELSPEVAGLRRIGGVLEAVDEGGNATLRVAEPTLVDSSGKVVTANLDVEGCVADTRPSAPETPLVLPPYSRLCTVVISWDGAGLTYPVLVDPSWVSASKMASPRTNFTLSWLPNGRVLAVGGADAAGSPLSSTELYDLTRNLWSSWTPMRYARSRHVTTPLWNGKVLITGGLRTSTVATATAETIDIATGVRADAASMSGARYAHTATLLPNGNVLVVGGLPSGTESAALADVMIYLSSGNSWMPLPNYSARAGHTATPLSDGNVLVVGGVNNGVTIASADLFNTTTLKWSAAGTLGSGGRVFHTATLLQDGKVLVVGGGVPSIVGTIPRDSVDIYSNGIWTAGPPLNVGRVYATANLLPDGKVLVVGGYGVVNGVLTLLSSSEIYDPATNRWQLFESTSYPRAYHASVSVPNSNATKDPIASPMVIIAGGYSASTAVEDRAELIALASCTGVMSPGDGSGGVFAPTADTVLPSGLYQFAAINIPQGVRVTASGSGVLDLRAATIATVRGTIDVSGSRGGDGVNNTEDTVLDFFEKKGANGGGGATGNPNSPGATGRRNTCYDGVALGGDGGFGSGPGGTNVACGAGGGKYGGGTGGGNEASVGTGSGAGGGGYAGGSGGCGSDRYSSLPGAGGGTYGGGGTGSCFTDSARGGKGGTAPAAYKGGDGGGGNNPVGGGGGSIGSDAAADLAVMSNTFRTGSGGGGGGSHEAGNGNRAGGGGGGGGGGAVRILSARKTSVEATGSVLARGGNGGGRAKDSGQGGSGSGGLIILAGDTLNVFGVVRVDGGAAGSENGAAGGLGRVVLSAGSQSRCSITESNVIPHPLRTNCVASTGFTCSTGDEPECDNATVLLGQNVCASVDVTPVKLILPHLKVAYATTMTLRASGGSGHGYTYQLLSGAGSVVASTGVYTSGSQTGTDTLQVTDFYGNKATATLGVSPLIPKSSATSVFPLGGASASATGGQGTYTWRLSVNNSKGTIGPTSGVYVAGTVGSVTDSLEVTDGAGAKAVITVAVKAAITLTPSSASLTPMGTQTFTAVGGSGTGYTWTVPTYPSGGTHASATSGAYKAGNQGSVTDVIRVTDSLGNSAEAKITVGPAVRVKTPTVNVGLGGMATLQAEGGSSVGYSWSLLAAPSGGSIDPSTGVYTSGLSGPTSDIVQVRDSLGATGTATVQVASPILISPPSLDGFAPRNTTTFVAVGGSGTGWTWSVTGNSGATINATTGAYKAGTFGYTQDTVQVRDSFGNTAIAKINVGAGVSVGPTLAVVPQKGSVAFTVSGGSGGPYTWQAPTSGDGTISADGVFTAGTACLYQAFVTAVDSLGNFSSASVQVSTCFAIVASATTVPAGAGPLALSTVGGSGSGVSFRLTGGSGGSIDAATGAYTAGPVRGTQDTITATDSLSNSATLTINVY